MTYTTWLNAVLDRLESMKLDGRSLGANYRQLFNRGLGINDAVKTVTGGQN